MLHLGIIIGELVKFIRGGIKIPTRGLFYLRAVSYVANFGIGKYIFFRTQSNVKVE